MTAFAQLEVKEGSFKEVSGFVNINTDKMDDDNNVLYAVIKVNTVNINDKQRHQLLFQGNAATFIEVEYHVGEVWVYLSSKPATYLKISHPDFGSTEFWFPFDLTPKQGYEMVLVNKANAVISGWAALTVTTKPENGAKVLLNGRDINDTTPYTNKMIPSGKYEITVSKYRFVKTTKTVEIQDGENKTVEIEMPFAYGKLIVNSEPSGAAILIDGIDYGVTPAELNNVVIGTHELKLEKSGCATVIKSITFDETNKLTINEKLSTSREIAISTDGTGDKIFVDGNYIGETPLTATLSFGQHEVKAVRDGKETSKKITVAQNGSTTSVQLAFSDNRIFTVNGVTFEMVAVKGGTFTMGCTSEQSDCWDDEKPTHSVTLSDYYIGKFEVIQELWKAVMGSNPSRFKGDNLPVEKVSWDDAQKFIRKLNQQTGQNFRLPTEAEWEYAARGGNKSRGYKYSGSNNIGEVAWYTDNSGSKTHQVGTKAPNELGIYDMSGNVWEWCQDWFGNYSSGNQTNPKGASTGSYRVLRGGSWFNIARGCRVSVRFGNNPDHGYDHNGFRLVLGGDTSVQLAFATGAINSVFSVSSSKKVQFSKGNLQYQASTKIWRFAEHQWDVIGDDNKNISSSYSGWIDLFGWGTSGYNGKNPWMTSTTSTDYGNGKRNIAGTNYDWGVYNTISNGEGKSWRTLTRDEWVYVFDTRKTGSGIRYAKATVNGVTGVILLPDNWSSSNYSLSNTNKTDASFSSNRISQTDWINKFETNGAVFLPAAGFRNGTNLYYVGSNGNYWSASYNNSNRARSVWFSDGDLRPGDWSYRKNGQSVRLVCPAEN